MTRTCGIFLYDCSKQAVLAVHPTYTAPETWGIPKGLADDNESPWIAAIREMEEETGLLVTALSAYSMDILKDKPYPNGKKTLVPFLCVTERVDFDFWCASMVESKHGNFPEVDAYRWMKLHELRLLHSMQSACQPEIEEILKRYGRL